jgi:hypothetical protein
MVLRVAYMVSFQYLSRMYGKLIELKSCFQFFESEFYDICLLAISCSSQMIVGALKDKEECEQDGLSTVPIMTEC